MCLLEQLSLCSTASHSSCFPEDFRLLNLYLSTYEIIGLSGVSLEGEDGFQVGEKYPRLEVGVGPQPRYMSQSSLFWEKSSLRLPRLVTLELTL